MPQSKPRRRKGHGEVMPPLSVFDRIDSLLKEHLKVFPTKAELTEGEIEHWHRDLGRFPIQAIEWAFENWRLNGHFFPVYDDILSQCRAWEPEQKYMPGCSRECQSRHNKGYGEQPFKGIHDITRLNELVRRKIEKEKRTLANPLTDAEIDGLLDELDKMRGGPPEWRV